MSKVKLLLVLMSLGIIFNTGCKEESVVGFENPSDEKDRVDKEFLQNLRETALLVGSIANDLDVRDELLGYAMPRTGGEVLASFDELLEPNEPSGRSNPAFSKKFRALIEGKKKSSIPTPFADGFESFLKENEICIFAPYFAENHASSQELITLTYWDGIDESGQTPGMVFKKTDSGYELKEEVLVDDDYAYEHPTWVIGPYLVPEAPISPVINLDEFGLEQDGADQRIARDIDCRTLDNSKILRIFMPQFRLLDNTRGWPSGNNINLWVITGDFKTNSSGEPDLASNVNLLMSGRHISRNDAKKKNWVNSNISYFKDNWKNNQIDLYFIFAHEGKKKSKVKVKATASVLIDDESNVKYNQSLSVETEIERGGYNTMVATSFDRCGFLADHRSSIDFGTREGYTVYRYDKLEFYLKPTFIN